MVKVEIPDKIYVEIERRVKESREFESVEKYINFVLEEVLRDEGEPEAQTPSKEDEEKVKERLRGLGYL